MTPEEARQEKQEIYHPYVLFHKIIETLKTFQAN